MTARQRPIGALAALAFALAPSAAAADARPAETGLFAEAGFGAAGFVGRGTAGRNHSRVGFAAHARAGYDLARWLSVGVNLGVATHEADVPPPPDREYYQLYTGAAEARLGVPIGRVELFVDGGAGVARISTNILERAGILDPEERTSAVVSAGTGLEYQLQNRHYAFGVAAQFAYLPTFERSSIVTGRAYLRYTY